MNIVIVGGGKVGYYLAKTLVPGKHHVTLIEEDLSVCNKIATELSNLRIEVMHGDGTEIECLRDAEVERADLFIAVTGHDEDNLVACQIVQNMFGAPRTIARVNNPKNIGVFTELGVGSVVSSTALIADIIEQEVDWTAINDLLLRKVGDVCIRDLQVTEESPAIGKAVHELGLGQGAILISIIRDHRAIIPNGQTVIQADDTVIALVNREQVTGLQQYFAKGWRTV